MSRRIIHNLVIPILQGMLTKNGLFPQDQGLHRNILHDVGLEEFLEKRISAYLGIHREPNEGHCVDLDLAISKLMKSNEEEFKKLLWKLVRDYVRDYLKKPEEELDPEARRLLKKLREKSQPPDRMKDLREKGDQVWSAIQSRG